MSASQFSVRARYGETGPMSLSARPEEFCKTIEVIDGHVVKCESPSRVHNRVALKIEEYRLEPAGVYRLVQIHTRRLTMENPIPLDVRFGELNQA